MVKSFEELTPSLRVLLGKIVRIALIFIAVLVAIFSHQMVVNITNAVQQSTSFVESRTALPAATRDPRRRRTSTPPSERSTTTARWSVSPT